MQREKERPGAAAGDTYQQNKEEISFLRQKFSSLMMRGHYKECFKLIEENLRLLYFKERWPENFFASLRLHKKAYPSMENSQPYDEYLAALLKKHGIPSVFVTMLRGSDSSINWSVEFFRDLTLVAEGKEAYEEALGYCELMIKMDPLNTSGYLLKGWIHGDLEQYQEAQEAYEQALERNRTNHQAWYGLAQLHLKKDLKQALEFIGTAIEYASGEARYFALKAQILLQGGNRKDAMECYDQARTLDPLNAVYPYEQGEILLADGQKLAAMRQYSQAVGNDEKHIPSLLRLAELFAETQPETALPYINTVCTDQPENLDACLLRADLLRRTGNAGGAVKQYKKVLELDPSCDRAYGAMGDLSMEDSAGAALTYYDRALALADAKAEYHFGKAQALMALQRKQEAIAEYQATVRLDKRNAKAWGILGLIHLEEKPTAAVEYLDKAIALDQNNAEYYRAKGEGLLKTGKGPGAAAECLDLAVKCDPGNAALQLRLAQLLEENGSTASAIEHYRCAISLDTHSAPAYYGLAGLILEETPETALIYINTAIHLDATNGAYYYLKAKVLNELKEIDKSVDLVKKAYEKDSHNTELMEELSLMMSGQSLRIALLYINRAIEHSPENSSYLCTRASILLSLGEREKALGQYQEAIKMDAGCHEAYYGTGKLLLEKKEDKKALEHFEKAISLAPAIARYHAEKARILARNDETYKQAVASYEDAIVRDKENWKVIVEKARLLDRHGDLIGAQEHYRRALLVNRDCLEATARMGQVLAEHGAAAGLVYLDHAIALDPENSAYHVWKAQLQLVLGREALAEDACREAILLGAQDDNVYATLAQVLRSRMPETALKYIKTAIELAPDVARHYLLKGDVHRTLGEWDNAKEAYRKVLSLEPGSHDAMAKVARLLRREKSEESLVCIDAALEKSPENPSYLYIKARILEEVSENLPAAVECAAQAVKADPDSVKNRELLVAMLQRNRSKVKLALERLKLERCRQRQLKLEEALLQMEGLPEKPPAEEPEDQAEMPPEPPVEQAAPAGASETIPEPAEPQAQI